MPVRVLASVVAQSPLPGDTLLVRDDAASWQCQQTPKDITNNPFTYPTVKAAAIIAILRGHFDAAQAALFLAAQSSLLSDDLRFTGKQQRQMLQAMCGDATPQTLQNQPFALHLSQHDMPLHLQPQTPTAR